VGANFGREEGRGSSGAFGKLSRLGSSVVLTVVAGEGPVDRCRLARLGGGWCAGVAYSAATEFQGGKDASSFEAPYP
jgi:hypothetical protein